MAAPRVSHHGDALLQVEATPAQLHELGFDVWTHRATEPNVLVRVTPQQRAQLDATGWPYAVVEPDLGPALDHGAECRPTASGPLGLDGLDPAYHDSFRDLDAIYDRLETLAEEVPERVRLVEIGLSLEGRPIRGIRVSNRDLDLEEGSDQGSAVDRPAVLVQSCQHAREWIAAAATMWAMEQFVIAPEGSELDSLLDQAELIVVPVANPDGFVHSCEVERLWRKNRRDGHGVDLNRNWSTAWGGDGSSGLPDAGNYRGTGPFSEPEAAAMRDFMVAESDLVAALDVHTYGQLFLYPWGFEVTDAPDDALFVQLADQVVDAMGQPHDTTYVPLQAAAFYPAAGNAMDWAYGARGLYSVAMELRPAMGKEPGFLLGPEFIVPTGEELLEGIEVLVESSVALGPGAPGDSGGPVDPEPESTGDDDGFDDDDGDGAGSTESSGGTTGAPDDEPPQGTTGPAPAAGDESGCGCRSTDAPGGAWWLLWGGVWLVRPRRRASRQRPRRA
ncbi:MAG: M14 family zinc carboxypeptidase [Myxococcota bacterium]